MNLIQQAKLLGIYPAIDSGTIVQLVRSGRCSWGPRYGWQENRLPLAPITWERYSAYVDGGIIQEDELQQAVNSILGATS